MTIRPPAEGDSFPVSDRNRLKRLPVRGTYDKQAVHAILDAAYLCHIAYVIDGQPFCTPVTHWREGDVLYWHGSPVGRLNARLRDGAPVCVTVSHLDGLVLARSAFHHSVNYRSAMCFGTARLIEDFDHKARALIALIDRLHPGRSAGLRPMTEQEVRGTAVVAMPIDEASAKSRAAGVGDDEADHALPIWAGVIPVRTMVGAAEPCPRVLPGVDRPAGLAPYREGRRLDEVLLEAQRTFETVG